MSDTLDSIGPGQKATVKAVHGDGRITRRLMEMGVVPGVAVTMVKAAPFGDPIEIRLLGYNLAVRRSEAAAVEIEPEPFR
jgi:ferrous iron transport protein A